MFHLFFGLDIAQDPASSEMVLKTIPVGFIVVEKTDGRIVYVNDRFVEITGFNPSGFLFKEYVLDIVKARMLDDGPYLYEQLPLTKALLYGKTTCDQEIVIYRPDSSEVTVIENSMPIIDGKGEITGAFSILADISKFKKANDALKKSEENYRYLLRYAPAAIFEIDYKLPSFWSVNEAMCILTGYTESELLSLNPFHLLEPESAERLKDRIKRGLAGEKISEAVEYKAITKDGRHLWVILYVKPVYRADKLNNALVVGYDITERKKAEETLKQSEEQLRIQERKLSLIYNNVSERLFSLSVEPNNLFRFTSINHTFLDALGLQENQVVGKSVQEVIPEPTLTIFLEKCNQAIAKKETVRWEEITVYPSGKKYGDATIAPLFDSDERCKYLIGNVHDVTEHKKAEEALKESEERFRIMADGTPNILWVTDKKGKNQFVNKYYREYFGVSGQVCGDEWQTLYHPDDAPQYIAKFFEAVREHKSFVAQTRGRRSDGEWRWLETTATPRFSSNGEFLGHVGITTDITERKQIQQQLEDYTKNLEKIVSERTKQLQDSERFAAIGATAGMVGHDIRNPLQAMMSDVYLLKDELTSMPECKTKEGVAESLNDIERNIVYINKIVADLQDYARLLEPEYSDVDLSEVINNVFKTVEVPDDIKLSINIKTLGKMKTDPTFIRRAISNLVTNAIQAMPNGGNLTISAFQKKRKMAIIFEDTGVGIPEAIKPKLFIPMTTTKSKGQGFGLAVVKRLIEALNGTITFESQEGKGTKFIIELPLQN